MSTTKNSTGAKRKLFCTIVLFMAIFALAGILAACQPQISQSPAQSASTSALTEASSSVDINEASSESSPAQGATTTQASFPAAAEAFAQAVPQPSGSCLECHTDQAKLEVAKSSEEVDTALYLVDEQFAATTHGMLGCTYCHGGHADAQDASAAMVGINRFPSSDAGASICATCHGEIAANFATSLHYTTAGLETTWHKRLEQASEAAGQDLASQYYHHDEMEGACVDCHADCGECHVRNAKTIMFGTDYNGLIKGHMFVDGTDNDDIAGTCMICHAGSIAGCYTEFDVHGLSGANMNCMDCHAESDIHGDGTVRTTMAHSGAVTTECEDCHTEASLSGQWHSQTHLEANQCWACHASDYNTCYNCHGWNAGTRDDVPFTQETVCILGYDTHVNKITTLAKAPVDGGMLGDAVSQTMDDADLNNSSTWWPAFTHGVIKPMVNQEFCNRCHGVGTALLDEAKLQYPDYETSQIVSPLPEVKVEDYA